jgi:hypothetical protein
MSLQALGTTPVPMQFRIPLGKLAELLRSTPKSLRRRLAFEAVVVEASSIVARVFLTEAPVDPAENAAIARELLRLTKEVGGQTYATGRFFQDEAAGVYGAVLLDRLRQFCHATDPADRLNPGTAFRRSG